MEGFHIWYRKEPDIPAFIKIKHWPGSVLSFKKNDLDKMQLSPLGSPGFMGEQGKCT